MNNPGKGNINVAILKQLYESDPVARIIFDYLAERQRNYAETTPERLLAILYQKGSSVKRAAVIDFFRKLEGAGCGKYMEGRRGHSSRFEWFVKMHDVGQAARGTKITIEQISPEEKVLTDDVNGGSITHHFRLRPDLLVKVDLPADFKTGEAMRLSDWIKTLPFD